MAEDARDQTRFSGQPKTTIQVDLLVNRYSDEELINIFGEVEDKVRLSMRSVEYGGFMVREGKAMVLCGQAGEPLRGQSGKNRVPFKPSLWNRSVDPIFIVRAKSWISEMKELDEITKELPAELLGVFCREIPDQFKSFDFEGEHSIRDVLISAADSTFPNKMKDYSEVTLESAINAAISKACCEGCTHVHYGSVTVREGEPQPEHNVTPVNDMRRIKSLA